MYLIRAVIEYNEDGFLIYADNYPGAYTRGKTEGEALAKLTGEIRSYQFWATAYAPSQNEPIEIQVVQRKRSDMQICDADTDVIFTSEQVPLTAEEYDKLKALALKSAADFDALYLSIPDKNRTTLQARKTFYGPVPRTAQEMYEHTNNVTDYYVGEIGVTMDNLPNIRENRNIAFEGIESTPDYLNNIVYDGSYGEQWSLRKVLRRFIWHDRIHAKAMYRMATKIWGKGAIRNPYHF